MIKLLSLGIISATAVSAANTILDDQLCQVYYTLDDDCATLRSQILSHIRGDGVPTLELGDHTTRPAMVFFHGWPDTSAIFANQFSHFCGEEGDYFCISLSWMNFNPDVDPIDDDAHTLANQVELFRSVIDELGLKDLNMVIFDVGAIIGCQFIWKYSKLVSQVIASSPPIHPTFFTSTLSKAPYYQQVNIEAYKTKNDTLMDLNINKVLLRSAPCTDCSIAPNSTGVGYRTGWPYYRVSEDLFSAGIDVPDDWHGPPFPDNLPLIYISPNPDPWSYPSWLWWIDNRGDNVSKHVTIADSDHWFAVRKGAETNAAMSDWLKTLDAVDNVDEETVDQTEKEVEESTEVGEMVEQPERDDESSSAYEIKYGLLIILIVVTIDLLNCY